MIQQGVFFERGQKMKLLITDLETTGLDPSKDKIIEVGAILYSVDHQCTLQQLSTLLPCEENPAENINRIKNLATKEVSNNTLLQVYKEWVKEADYIVAYNANFEKSWLKGITKEKPWICAYEDIIWPNNHKQTNLVATALNHGVGVSLAHRALADCQILAQLFDRMDDLPEMLRKAVFRSIEERVYVVAEVVFDEKDKAKEQKFKWDNVKRHWHKIMVKSDYEKEKNDYTFKTQIVPAC